MRSLAIYLAPFSSRSSMDGWAIWVLHCSISLKGKLPFVLQLLIMLLGPLPHRPPYTILSTFYFLSRGSLCSSLRLLLINYRYYYYEYVYVVRRYLYNFSVCVCVLLASLNISFDRIFTRASSSLSSRPIWKTPNVYNYHCLSLPILWSTSSSSASTSASCTYHWSIVFIRKLI